MLYLIYFYSIHNVIYTAPQTALWRGPPAPGPRFWGGEWPISGSVRIRFTADIGPEPAREDAARRPDAHCPIGQFGAPPHIMKMYINRVAY